MFEGRPWIRRTRPGVVAALALAGLVSCGAGRASERNANPTLRLGYFPNVTHATAVVGIEKGIFARALGPQVGLDPKIVNAGPSAVEALFSGALDATYIGPNPAVNAFVRSHGRAIRIVSGATSGGAFLVVKPSIRRPKDLRGKKIASPQLGNTQDVALRSWLASHGFATDTRGGGDVSVVPQENAQTLQTFKTGDVDGAWVPEPWASRLILEGGGVVLVDEGDLWPAGRYVTTHLIVRTEFLREHRALVARLVRAQVEANEYLNANPAGAKVLAGDAIERLTGKRLPPAVIDRAWSTLTFTNDPVASSLRTSAKQARKLGLLPAADLDGIYDLSLLNAVLAAAGKPEVAAA